jgi:2'-5' RNA ligase
MRCFFAVEFDDETKKLLAGIQDVLRQNGISGNYSRSSNFHLTLKFLGEINPVMLSGLERVMKKVASRHKSFVLEFGELGKFSKGRRPVVWCGLKASKPMTEVQEDLVKELAFEFPKFSGNERYVPHITLVREAALETVSSVDAGSGRTVDEENRLDELLNRVRIPEHRITVKGISLMESTRIDGRLVYVRRLYAALRND